jgi:hypothetical protein
MEAQRVDRVPPPHHAHVVLIYVGDTDWVGDPQNQKSPGSLMLYHLIELRFIKFSLESIQSLSRLGSYMLYNRPYAQEGAAATAKAAAAAASAAASPIATTSYALPHISLDGRFKGYMSAT